MKPNPLIVISNYNLLLLAEFIESQKHTQIFKAKIALESEQLKYSLWWPPITLPFG